MNDPTFASLAQQIQKDHFMVFPAAIPKETCDILALRVSKLMEKGELLKCEQCISSLWAYDDPVFKEVHQAFVELLSDQLGINMLPSFSSVRYYPKGEILNRHLDREAAEFVLSLTVDYSGQEVWPLYLQGADEGAVKHDIQLGIGDAVLFQGPKLYHWREPLENDWQVQAFFFFVDGNGPNKDHAGDMINKYKERD